MSASRWSASLSVGHEVLDEHHRALFDLLAEIDAGLNNHPDAAWARSIGQSLTDYMDYHFRAEEALLEAAGFPFLQFHRASHQAIAMRVHALLDGLATRPLAEVLGEVRDFVGDWLSHHIEIEDFEYKPYLSPVG